MKNNIRIDQFLDDSGRITKLPSKHKTRLVLLEYLAGKFQFERSYSEREINEICDKWHTFGDYFLLRRELVDNSLINRERDGSRYWRTWEDTPTDGE